VPTQELTLASRSRPSRPWNSDRAVAKSASDSAYRLGRLVVRGERARVGDELVQAGAVQVGDLFRFDGCAVEAEREGLVEFGTCPRSSGCDREDEVGSGADSECQVGGDRALHVVMMTREYAVRRPGSRHHEH